MSDLISRSETIKKLREYAEQKHRNGEVELANGILKAVCFIKNEGNIPVAYDVGKVVEKVHEVCYFGGIDDDNMEEINEIIRTGGAE